MSVLVRNELDHEYVFGRGSGASKLASGEVGIIAPEELNSVPSGMRGPGGINPLDASARVKTEFDYESVNGLFEVVYIGQASPGTLDATPLWTIKKFSYQSLGGANKVSAVEVFDSVAWSDRATLDWA